jgi:hypothetical protein
MGDETLDSVLDEWIAALQQLAIDVQRTAAAIRAIRAPVDRTHFFAFSPHASETSDKARHYDGQLLTPATAACQIVPADADRSYFKGLNARCNADGGTARFLRNVAMRLLKYAAAGTTHHDEADDKAEKEYVLNVLASVFVQSDMQADSATIGFTYTHRILSELLTLYGRGFSLIGSTWCTKLLKVRPVRRVPNPNHQEERHGIGYIGPARARARFEADCSVLDDDHAVSSVQSIVPSWGPLVAAGEASAACAILQSGFNAADLALVLASDPGSSASGNDIETALSRCKQLYPLPFWSFIVAGQYVPHQHGASLVMHHDGRTREKILDIAFKTQGKPTAYDVTLVLAGYTHFVDRFRVVSKWLQVFDTAILEMLLRSHDIYDHLTEVCNFCSQSTERAVCAGRPALGLFVKLMVNAAVQPEINEGSLNGLWKFCVATFNVMWCQAIRDRLAKIPSYESRARSRGVTVTPYNYSVIDEFLKTQ